MQEDWKRFDADPYLRDEMMARGLIGSKRSIVTYGTTTMWFDVHGTSGKQVVFHDTERILVPEPDIPRCVCGYIIGGPVRITIDVYEDDDVVKKDVYWEYDPDLNGIVGELDITTTRYHFGVDDTWFFPWQITKGEKWEPISRDAAFALLRVKPKSYELYQEFRGYEEACEEILSFCLEAGRPFPWSTVKEELEGELDPDEFPALADLMGFVDDGQWDSENRYISYEDWAAIFTRAVEAGVLDRNLLPSLREFGRVELAVDDARRKSSAYQEAWTTA